MNRKEMRGNEGAQRLVGLPNEGLGLHNPDHFRFVRQSGLPHGYFDRDDGLNFWRGALWACAVGAAAWGVIWWLAWRVGG